MGTYFYRLLSDLERDGALFRDVVNKISKHDSTWTEAKIVDALDKLYYDGFLCIDSDRPHIMVGMMAFNPSDNVAKVFLVYVCKEFRGQGTASVMVAEFLSWAVEGDFNGAQIGLGKSPAAVALLRAFNKKKYLLLQKYASRVEITPETGAVVFSPCVADHKLAAVAL